MDSIYVTNYFTNGIESSFILAAFFFLLLAFVTSKWFQFTIRDIESERTPLEVSWKFWWLDNYNSVISFFLMCFPIIVFTEDLVHWLGLNFLPDAMKTENPMYIYYIFGLSFSWVLEVILKKAKLIRNAQK
jgi:hypothetical protein